MSLNLKDEIFSCSKRTSVFGIFSYLWVWFSAALFACFFGFLHRTNNDSTTPRPKGEQGPLRIFWELWVWLTGAYAAVYFGMLNRTKIDSAGGIQLDGNCVIVSNHISNLDPALIVIAILAYHPKCFVRPLTKAELFQIPIVRSILRHLGCIPVRRDGTDISGMRKISEIIKMENVLIFPEGMRSMDGNLLSGKRAVGRVIHWSKPKIIPAAVWGTHEAMPKGAFIPRIRKRFGVRFGPPLDMEALYDMPITKESSQNIVKCIMEAIDTIKMELESEGKAVQIKGNS